MQIAVFDAQPLETRSLQAANAGRHAFKFVPGPLDAGSAGLARGCAAVCVGSGDGLKADCLAALHAMGVRFVALRCAGTAGMDVAAAQALGLQVARVPAWSPDAVAEHAVTLVLALARKLHGPKMEADDESGDEAGSVLRHKCVGVIGSGTSARGFAEMMRDLGCRVLVAASPGQENLASGEVALDELLATADVVSLHGMTGKAGLPVFSHAELARMKPGAMLVSTSRGRSIDLRATMASLAAGKLGALGLDLYEDERSTFLEPGEQESVADELFTRLLSFPHVIVTSHQAFMSSEASDNTAATIISNLSQWEETGTCDNLVKAAEQN